MKRFLEYFKVFIIVFISIVILYYLEILFYSRLHILVETKLREYSSHLYFYEFIFFTIFDFCFALIGFFAIRFYKSSKAPSIDLLFLFSIPALLPIFMSGVQFVGSRFFKPCFTPQYSSFENLIVITGIIFHWAYAIGFGIYVLLNVPKKYAFVFILEYLIFLLYLSMFYAKLVGPIKLPFHIL